MYDNKIYLSSSNVFLGNISVEEAEERINRNDILNAKHILSNLMESKIDYKIDSKN